MAAIDALIFDLGNVLVFHDNQLLAERFASRLGVSAERVSALLDRELAEATNRGTLPPERVRPTVLRALGLSEDTLGDAEFQALFSSHFRANEPVLELVDRLADRLPLVLLSNTNALHWRYLAPRLPVLRRFKAVLLSFELGLMKPERRFFERALSAAETAPARAAFFDDIAPYVDAARALGMQGAVYRSFPELVSALKQLGVDTGR